MLRPILVTTALLACALLHPPRAQAQLEFKMISSGGNRPSVAIWMAPNIEIAAGLHAGIPVDGIAANVGLPPAAVQARIDSMVVDGTIRIVDGRARPSCMVISVAEGAGLTRLAADAASAAMPLMRELAERARTRHPGIPALRDMPYEDVSFFLVSDVVLDAWQIGAVEREWLRAERPRRGRANYYCSVQARADADREAFGMYGNNSRGVGGGRVLGVYGNRRGGPSDLSALSQQRLARMLGRSEGTDRQALLAALVDAMIRFHREGEADPALRDELASRGVLRDGRPRFAAFDSVDNRMLDELAASATAELVAFLQSYTPRLRQAWEESPWRDETTFEEYAIWWYHFFYTAVTDQLAEQGLIHVPETGLFHYVLYD